MSEAALAAPRRVSLADLLRPVDVPTPEARAAAREAEAWRRGRDAGLAEAAQSLADLEAAHHAAVAQANEAQAAAAQVLAKMQQALQAALADSLATLSLAVARAVLGAEPAIAPATLRSLLADLVTATPELAHARLRANPDALALLEPLLPTGWSAEADPSLDAGTLLAEADSSALAAGLTPRLEQLATLLQGAPA